MYSTLLYSGDEYHNHTARELESDEYNWIKGIKLFASVIIELTEERQRAEGVPHKFALRIANLWGPRRGQLC